MNDSVLVNQVYLIFNRPQFLVDSSVWESKMKRRLSLEEYVKSLMYVYSPGPNPIFPIEYRYFPDLLNTSNCLLAFLSKTIILSSYTASLLISLIIAWEAVSK